MNHIETIWAIVQQRMYSRYNGFNNVCDLEDAFQKEWDKVTQEECQKLISTMDNRLAQVIERGGGHTDY